MGRQAVFPDITAMRDSTGRINGDIVFVADEPESFRYDSESTATVDNVKYFTPDGMGGAGRWIRQVPGLTRDGAINVLEFGFSNDNSTDNYAAWTSLITAMSTMPVRMSIYFPPGFYVFNTRPVLSLPYTRVFGAGKDATWIVCDNGILANYQGPEFYDLGICPTTANSSNTGLELRNTWESTCQNLRIRGFDIGVHLKLDDEGESLLPGQDASPPYTVPQFGGGGVHTSWPDGQEFKRDATITEHAGSRVTIATFINVHIKGDVAGKIGYKLENTLADVTTDYDDNNSLTDGTGTGVFFTGTQIYGGHVFCKGTGLDISGGCRGTRVYGTYFDCEHLGVHFRYGASNLQLLNTSLDFGGDYGTAWLPSTSYAVDDLAIVANRRYKYTTAGTSAATVDMNGVPNSEFIGVAPVLVNQPVVDGDNPDDILTQPYVFGMDFLSDEVQIFVHGIEVFEGKRWLRMSTYMAATDASNQSANIWFGNPGLSNQRFPAVSGDTMRAGALFQLLDPKAEYIPDISLRIRSANTSGAFTEQSTGTALNNETGFGQGRIITYTESDSLTDGTTATSAPFLLVTYASGNKGWCHFRVAQPQINAGASLGTYVRTYGQIRASHAQGPTGTGTGISDGTAVCDYDGNATSAILASRRAWDSKSNRYKGEIEFTGNFGTTLVKPAIDPPAFMFRVFPNPTNSNGDPTTIPD